MDLLCEAILGTSLELVEFELLSLLFDGFVEVRLLHAAHHVLVEGWLLILLILGERRVFSR